MFLFGDTPLTVQLVPVGTVCDTARKSFIAFMAQSHYRVVLSVHRGQMLEQLIIRRRTVLATLVMISIGIHNLFDTMGI